jgi:hypothetical protein
VLISENQWFNYVFRMTPIHSVILHSTFITVRSTFVHLPASLRDRGALNRDDNAKFLSPTDASRSSGGSPAWAQRTWHSTDVSGP